MWIVDPRSNFTTNCYPLLSSRYKLATHYAVPLPLFPFLRKRPLIKINANMQLYRTTSHLASLRPLTLFVHLYDNKIQYCAALCFCCTSCCVERNMTHYIIKFTTYYVLQLFRTLGKCALFKYRFGWNFEIIVPVVWKI